jgi:hypothetical protein
LRRIGPWKVYPRDGMAAGGAGMDPAETGMLNGGLRKAQKRMAGSRSKSVCAAAMTPVLGAIRRIAQLVQGHCLGGESGR